MLALILVTICLLASASSFVELSTDYHYAVGIPLAAEIKAYEDVSMSSGMLYEYRIVGGMNAPINAYPYLAGLLISFMENDKVSACGASLLTANRLVTAAHCWFDGVLQGVMFEVVLGSSTLFYGGTRVNTSSVILHPNWRPKLLRNDIAMIFLPTSVKFSESIQPISLPSLKDLSEDFIGHRVVAAGYGRTSDAKNTVNKQSVVLYVDLLVITEEECRCVYGCTKIQQSNICTSGRSGRGICTGDSGGPLVTIRNEVPILIGVSSLVAKDGCEVGYPSVFSRVASFYYFILHHL